MKVSTAEISSLIYDGFFSSNSLHSLKKLLDENPETIHLMDVLACFNKALYTNEWWKLTNKNPVLSKIIRTYFGISRLDLIDDYKNLNLDENSLNQWIPFCYYMKERSRLFLQVQYSYKRGKYRYLFENIRSILPKLIFLLEKFSSQGILTAENLNILAEFLSSSEEFSLISNKSLEQINEIPLNFWLFYVGESYPSLKENSEHITKIDTRYNFLPQEASLSTKSLLLTMAYQLSDEQYKEMILAINETAQNSPHFGDDLKRQEQLFETAILLQKAHCLSVLKQASRINLVDDLIAILPGLVINENFAKFSDENLAVLIQHFREKISGSHLNRFYRYSLYQFEEWVAPIKKKQIDLDAICGENKEVPLTLSAAQAQPQEVFGLLRTLHTEIKSQASPNIHKILHRNSLISEFFSEFSHHVVIEAIELYLTRGNTSFKETLQNLHALKAPAVSKDKVPLPKGNLGLFGLREHSNLPLDEIESLEKKYHPL